MSLTKLFNKNYAIQNIKKSKGILIIMMLVIPVISLFIMYNLKSGYYNVPFEVGALASPNIIGMFIIPFILSNVLLGYVYKQKSVDFINSMPINKKNIFITNIITGSLYIIFLQAINLIVQGIFIVISHTTVVFPMILDIFLVMTIGYLFMYSISCLALSLSGNKFTQIVVVMLILFMIPFTRIMIEENYHDGDVDIISENGIVANYYQDYINQFDYYTTPICSSLLAISDGGTIYNAKSNMLTLALFLIYIIIGMKIFEKKKMENNGTSFSSKKVHLLVKVLTIYPMVFFIKYLFFRDGNFDFDNLPQLIFAIALIFIYYLVYDLITAKKIKLLVNISSFIASIIILFAIVFFVNFTSEIIYDNEKIEINDIKTVSVNLKNEFGIEDEDTLIISNKDTVNFIINNISTWTGYEKVYRLSLVLELKNGRKEKIYCFMNSESYKKLIEMLKNDEKYLTRLKELYSLPVYSYFSTNDSYNLFIDLNKNNELRELINSNLDYFIKEKLNNIDDDDLNKEGIRLATYKNHKKYILTLNIYNSDVLNSIIKLQNKGYVENFKEIIQNSLKSKTKISYYSYELTRWNGIEYEYADNTIGSGHDGEMTQYILNNSNQEIDLNKPYYKIVCYNNLVYYTNDMEGIENILSKYSVNKIIFHTREEENSYYYTDIDDMKEPEIVDYVQNNTVTEN